MKIYSDHNTINTRRWVIVLSLLVCHLSCGFAQIKIGGNVYGGGNAGNTGGSTSVTVRAGDFEGGVYGGARQANVGGHAFVNIDGLNMSGDITINAVYGGNDIAGTVGHTDSKPEGVDNHLEISDLDSFNAFIHTTKERAESTYSIFIGQLFGGGNGDYDYTSANSPYKDMVKPELAKAYLALHGGTFGYVYGGGNNATVTEKTHICIDNSSTPATKSNDLHLNFRKFDENNNVIADGVTPKDHIAGSNLSDYNDMRLLSMGINLSTYQPGYNFLRVFGGNNKAQMHIRPNWHLNAGSIINLYSGGNEGNMTSPDGLLLEIKADAANLKVENVFGGCRKADVYPTQDVAGNNPVSSVSNIEGYKFPPNLAARVLVRGGDITNVYGGNDISGKVYFGNALGVYTSIKGDIYGGGNGSYAYTDNPDLKDDLIWGDFYYDKGVNSAKALNANRPNAEQVSIRVAGEANADGTMKRQVIIGGSIYVGGNSATLKPDPVHARLPNYPMAELKIGSYVIADKVFLGNNGEEMISRDVLEQYVGTVTGANATATTSDEHDFSLLDLTDEAVFAEYMNGCAMDMMPQVVFDDATRTSNPDPATYIDYSSYFGSFFCGGNVGSITKDGKGHIDFSHPVIIFDKLVGGCNKAFVYPIAKDGGGILNAAYNGGLTGSPDESGVKLQLDLEGLKIQPMRWKDESDKTQGLEWNTYVGDTKNLYTDDTSSLTPTSGSSVVASANDMARRFHGGNVYGGCYESGHVNGSVVININGTIIDREGEHGVFDTVAEDAEGEGILYDDTEFHITERRSGVILDQQGMDVLGSALSVFGGGYGKDSEIWGSTTVNLNKGYVFQVFGGGEQGALGHGTRSAENKYIPQYDTASGYDKKYSTTINLHGDYVGRSKRENTSDDMAEAEFIYGGGFEGLICGDTRINLGNGRVFNTFAGSCNADILGHTETYVGSWKVKNADNTERTVTGFPWIRDHIYGGNDLGGRIFGKADFSAHVRQEALPMVHGYQATANPKSDVLKASAYVEYIQGRVDHIFGGCYGAYDYTETIYDTDRVPNKPYLHNAFVNLRPANNASNAITKVFGAGQGYAGDREGDLSQDRSYVLVDIPQNQENFKLTEVFGAGSYDGLGMGVAQAKSDTPDGSSIEEDADNASAIIDLIRGQIGAAYGASYNEGITRRTVVNVPAGSTIEIGSIFGGAYGSSVKAPCDAYEANVNYHSTEAVLKYNPVRTDEDGNTVGDKLMKGNIYGGNNSARRTFYGRVNIDVPVKQNHWQYGMTNATVYGAGYGEKTWSQYTEVNLTGNAMVYEVYGGGENGRVINKNTITKYATDDSSAESFGMDLNLPDGYTDSGLNSSLAKARHDGGKYNTNVLIGRGTTVVNYAYGGGKGDTGIEKSGDVNGTTYIALLGGTVKKDVYAAGTVGAVLDEFRSLQDDFGHDFTAGTTAYIAGGTVRNVYGGGWKGSVGKHVGDIKDSAEDDIPGETHVIIGIRNDQTNSNKLAALQYANPDAESVADYGFYNGVPTVQRSAYAGGEGGAVYGTANLTLNNGYIGYEYSAITDKETGQTTWEYTEKLDDETYYEAEKYAGEGRLRDSGNVFGGGYDARSSVDFSNVKMYGGKVRGSLHGGGEIATIGRGSVKESSVEGSSANSQRVFEDIYKAGGTHIEIYNGHVLRNVFGGGKGYNILGYGGSNELYTDGYVFGSTEVYIHGGEIGTVEGVKSHGYGNVFGGGDIGYVYSKGIKNSLSGVTETGSPGHFYYYDDNNKLSEDCKVVVAPYLQVKTAGSIGSHAYQAYDYAVTDDLNLLPKKDADGNWPGDWQNLLTEDENGNERGVIIHNAVFGGGNVSSNSDKTYANATTVFGNTTATLYDVYHRDFITVGTEHTGGLYGGGNLSIVGGYRELNITNYGTDYYGLTSRITLDEYRNLSNRERAYFQLEYVCKDGTESGTGEHVGKRGVTVDGVFYENGQRVKEDDYEEMKGKSGFNESNWEQWGFCSIYAGRLLNTIQRADLCGVYGSRMVLQGAKDRVADIGENIDYTINRIGELSLNAQKSHRSADTGGDAEHGNYFGIYSIVNYLGNLTSDVRFGDTYKDSDGNAVEGTTYYSYKASRPKGNDRNYGTCHNQVALASGVFLEVTTEHSTAEKKDYGYITGVIELDLINVKRALEGGGFVYAKNEHRVPKYYPNKTNVILSPYNQANGSLRDEARTYKRYRYATPEQETADGLTEHDPQWAEDNWTESTGAYVISLDDSHVYQTMSYETSGNFIHPSDKRIVDDCYPINNAFTLNHDPYSEAHYWYVKGTVYIYDQVVSAYTGSATAYSKAVHLPLTITAASNGRLKLLNVKPNLYAYYYADGKKIGTDDNDGKVWVNNQTDAYELNDVITWWDWNNLSASEKKYFVEETYVNCVACTIDGQDYAIGEYVMNDADYAAFKTLSGHTVTYHDEKGEEVTLTASDIGNVFRTSNNVGHDTGYVLTFDMDTPAVWDDYYTKGTDYNSKLTKASYEAALNSAQDEAARQQIINQYVEGPSFRPSAGNGGVYGKQSYTEGDIITQSVYDETASGKEYMETAYVATSPVSYTYNGKSKTVNPGTAIPATEYEALGTEVKSVFSKAYVCISTVKLGEEDYLLHGELKTAGEIESMKAAYSAVAADIEDAMTPAYICTFTGEYGGRNYSEQQNYSAIQSWCALSEADRGKFEFNYDALDLLADPAYSIGKDGGNTTETAYHAPYSNLVPVEYVAVFKGDKDDATMTSFTYSAGTTADGKSFEGGTLAVDQSIPNDVFEAVVRNDKRYYTRIETGAGETTAYIASDNFTYNGTPYGKGQVVDSEVSAANPSVVETVTGLSENSTIYYCYEDYQSDSGSTVTRGTKITQADYSNLTDQQQYFVIQGKEPTETTTLYVNRESDIRDVTKEKVITVIYQYTYYENGDNGDIKLTNELHVVNIHLQLESGVPTIGTLAPPATVLPGSAVGLKAPEVKPGTYEVLTNGWEIFDSADDADHHRNGVPFENNSTPVYWYQNQDHYIAFYSKTYLGKTYSNYVPLSVANYHDIADLMVNHPDNHLFIDRADVDRPCKIYISDYSTLPTDDPRRGKNGLEELKSLFDLSLLDASTVNTDADGLITTDKASEQDSPFKGHAMLGSHVRGAENLDFILRNNIDGSSLTNSIAEGTTCFGGNLHGDGYTISGLRQSLFGKLCGSVYNLGATGSFTTAGIADTGDGYVENCWISTTGTPAENTKAVFGNPSRTGDRDLVQVVNSYYPSDKGYAGWTDTSHGNATPMPDEAFYNGEVAYNLNGFYLGKRYYDNNKKWTGTKKPYSYLPAGGDGTLPTDAAVANYADDYAYYTPNVTALPAEQTPSLGYVEHRFFDGDFRYADGTIPETANTRMRTVAVTSGTGEQQITTDVPVFYPIWPDDYLFFGQTLSYGHDEGRTHQAQPVRIAKGGDWVLTTEAGNRVYRAPAYFRNSNMKAVHFNTYAVFAATNADASKVVHKGMTAIDFTGYNDVKYDYEKGWKQWSKSSHDEQLAGKSSEAYAFYPPLLDDGGIARFRSFGLTQNLLAYTDVAGKTADAVTTALPDEAYAELDTGEKPAKYRAVAYQDPSSVKGHHVSLSGSDYVATNDHFLVDKQDFNAPIAYTFADGYRMWYQRYPDTYVAISWTDDDSNESTPPVRTTTGWEGISLPFNAEVVTTHQKGEITHFYNKSWESKNDKPAKIGHEYWLREFADGGTSEGSVYKANMVFPTTVPTGDELPEKKEFESTFLWDYYYSYNRYDDANTDDYQEDDRDHVYYKEGRIYEDYAYLTAAKPYIIGFPGATYREFDLSGNFTPANTLNWPVSRKLAKQYVTFASATGTAIGVSDLATGISADGYIFKPSYLNEAFAAGTANTYTLNAEGSSYDKVPATGEAVSVAAFRPYFVKAGGGNARTRSIIFGDAEQSQLGGDGEHSDADQTGTLIIRPDKSAIVVTSALSYTTDVRIFSTAGVTLRSFTIQPGETVESRVLNSGVYIVRTLDGQYTKKLSVK